MATSIRNKTSTKQKVRFRRKKRIFSKTQSWVSGKPRLAVFRSNAHIYVQIIDDKKGCTLVAASTLESELKGKVKPNIDGAKMVGQLVAKRALAKSVSEVVFDRGGYLYHGRIKALADAARESGLKF